MIVICQSYEYFIQYFEGILFAVVVSMLHQQSMNTRKIGIWTRSVIRFAHKLVLKTQRMFLKKVNKSKNALQKFIV